MNIKKIFLKLSDRINKVKSGDITPNEFMSFVQKKTPFSNYLYICTKDSVYILYCDADLIGSNTLDLNEWIGQINTIKLTPFRISLMRPYSAMLIFLRCLFCFYYETKTSYELNCHERLVLTLEYMLNEVAPQIKDLDEYKKYNEFVADFSVYKKGLEYNWLALLNYIKYEVLKQTPSTFSDYAYLV